MGVGGFEFGHGHGAVDDRFDLALRVALGQFGHGGHAFLRFAFGEVAPEHVYDRSAFEQRQIEGQGGDGAGGKGPDVIYDPVGGDFAEPAFRSIAWRGRYLVIGFAAGPIPALPLNLALLKGASIVGVFWGDFTKREPQKSMAAMAELAQWYAQGKIKPVIDRTMPMSELKSAYAHMGSRGVMGKLVMVNE